MIPISAAGRVILQCFVLQSVDELAGGRLRGFNESANSVSTLLALTMTQPKGGDANCLRPVCQISEGSRSALT